MERALGGRPESARRRQSDDCRRAEILPQWSAVDLLVGTVITSRSELVQAIHPVDDQLAVTFDNLTDVTNATSPLVSQATAGTAPRARRRSRQGSARLALPYAGIAADALRPTSAHANLDQRAMRTPTFSLTYRRSCRHTSATINWTTSDHVGFVEYSRSPAYNSTARTSRCGNASAFSRAVPRNPPSRNSGEHPVSISGTVRTRTEPNPAPPARRLPHHHNWPTCGRAPALRRACDRVRPLRAT